MRQIGTLPNQDQAERFTAYLITQGLGAKAEQHGETWEIWVRDEDHLDEARHAIDHFSEDPDNERYADVVREANAVIEEEAKRREEARKNLVQVRNTFGRPMARRAPLVTTVIFLCGIVFVVSGLGRNQRNFTMRTLSFCDTAQFDRDDWNPNSLSDRLTDVLHGQVWRLVTPIFLHAGIFHILFNMVMFHYFGSRIESRYGSWWLGLLILLIAVPSNLAQGLAPTMSGPLEHLSGGPNFLGMSGVVYGFLGYLWMKTVYAPEEGLYVSSGTLLILLAWLLMGFTGLLNYFIPEGGIANWAHAVGLLAGMAVGYFSIARGRTH
jgi:GlpG protein